MSISERKLSVLQSLLERVQTRAAAPRPARNGAGTATAAAVTAAAISESVEASDELELTPLVSDVASLEAEITASPSEEIIILEATPSPASAELELVIDDELESEAAAIEEALSLDDDEDEEPAVSSTRPSRHPLEAAMEPMTLDPISDRPTARITLPPEATLTAMEDQLAAASLPQIDVPSEAELEPEITISSEPIEMEWSEEPAIEQLGGLVELDEPLEALDLELAPASSPEIGIASPEKSELEADIEFDDPLDLSAPAEAAEELAARDRQIAEELSEEPLELEMELDVEPEAAAEEAVALPPMEEPLRLVPEEPAPAELPVPEEAVEPPAPLALELAAEMVRRPEIAETEVVAIVEAAEQFAPTGFIDLLDASLKL